tara:strand:- start:196 stop:2253 length:2058 start_codon:yes stop_codon:yes gene_type:complete
MIEDKSLLTTKHSHFKKINIHLALVIISLTVAIFFRLIDINRDIIIYDEAVSVHYFILPDLSAFFFKNYSIPNNHFFHSILANLSVQIFGIRELSFRLPVLISGILSVGFIYWWVFNLSYSKKTAFISSMFLALAPIHIAYSQTARGYSLVILFSILAQLSFYKLLENYKIRWAVVFIMSNALSVITIPTNIFFVASQFIALVFVYLTFKTNLISGLASKNNYKEKILNRNIIFYFFIIALIVFIFYYPILDQMRDHAKSTIPAFGNFSIMGVIFSLFKSQFLLGLPMVSTLIFLFGCMIFYSMKKFWGYYSLLLFVLPVIISIAAGMGYFPRIYLFCLPYFILAFSVGLYKLVSTIWIFLLKIIRSSLDHEKISTLTSILLFSLPFIYYLETNYYPQYKSHFYKELKKYTNKISGNSLFFKPNSLSLNFYINNSLKQNTTGIIASNNISDFYIIRELENGLSDTIQKYVYGISKDRSTLVKEFKNINFNEDFKCVFYCGDKPVPYSIYKLHPSNVRKLMNANHLKQTSWIQSEGRQKVNALSGSRLNQIEIEIYRRAESSLEDISFIHSDSTLKLSINGKGFIFLIYSFSYPEIGTGAIIEPAIPSLLIKNKNGNAFNGQPQYTMNYLNSLYSADNRLWYIMQKLIPIEKGDYDLKLGFFVRSLNENSRQRYLIRNFQAHIVEF